MIYVKTTGAPDGAAAPATEPARRRILLAAGLTLLGAASAWAQDQAQPRLPAIDLTAGMHVIRAEVASTLLQQQIGLMHRRTLGANEGMLFVYDSAAPRCFWMRNTLLPLSIAFVDDDGTIVNIADMQPLNDQSHCSARPVRFALEMNQGWFAKRGIGPGFRLRGAPFTPARN
jgi:hypothetical protein